MTLSESRTQFLLTPLIAIVKGVKRCDYGPVEEVAREPGSPKLTNMSFA